MVMNFWDAKTLYNSRPATERGSVLVCSGLPIDFNGGAGVMNDQNESQS
jgi:hypothetical protein